MTRPMTSDPSVRTTLPTCVWDSGPTRPALTETRREENPGEVSSSLSVLLVLLPVLFSFSKFYPNLVSAFLIFTPPPLIVLDSFSFPFY